jgi:hypothetical protein
VALKIEIHSLAKARNTKNTLIESNNLSSFFIDCSAVEVVHLSYLLRPNRVCGWTCVLAKLTNAQRGNILKPLDGLGVGISSEGLVSINSKTFLECELEPIAARNSK